MDKAQQLDLHQKIHNRGMTLQETISQLQREDDNSISELISDHCSGSTSFEKKVLGHLQSLYDKHKNQERLSRTDLNILMNQFTNFFNLWRTKRLVEGIAFHTQFRIPEFTELEKDLLRDLGFSGKHINLLESLTEKKKFPSYELEAFVTYIDRHMAASGINTLSENQKSNLLLIIARKLYDDIRNDIDEITLKNHFLETCIEYLDKEDWQENWLGQEVRKASIIHGDGSKKGGSTVINPRHKNDQDLSKKAAMDYWLKRRRNRLRRFRYQYIKFDRDELNWYIYIPEYISRYLYPKRLPAYRYTVTWLHVGEMEVATFPKKNEISLANTANYFGWLMLNE